MPNRTADTLYQLVKSLHQAEKRNFKLYAKRNFSNKDLQTLQLFDALDKATSYDEKALLKKTTIKKEQLSKVKARLYSEILTSMRLLESSGNIDIQLHEQLGNARILYNKGLYLQSLKLLEKIKESAKQYNQVSFMMQALFLIKKIESLHITRSLKERADELKKESAELTCQIQLVTQLSNLALQLYGWYIKHGHVRGKKDEAEVRQFFEENLPEGSAMPKGFYEKIYLYQSYCWYAFIRQDFLLYYRYTQKWVDLFTNEPYMIEAESAHYIKGMHNLLTAHFYLGNYNKFITVLKEFENYYDRVQALPNQNDKVQTFVYLHLGMINRYFMEGDFKGGLAMVPTIEEKLKEYELYLDRHRVLVFYYKIASLYFGSGDYERTIDYLNKIINWKTDLRTDLQCYSRLLHLIAHYELGNFQLVEYLVRSVYRFMAKMDNLSAVEREILNFLKNAFYISIKELKKAFEDLLSRLKVLEKDPYEARAFVYLDIISWLESKIDNKLVDEVIRQKFMGSIKHKAES